MFEYTVEIAYQFVMSSFAKDKNITLYFGKEKLLFKQTSTDNTEIMQLVIMYIDLEKLLLHFKEIVVKLFIHCTEFY